MTKGVGCSNCQATRTTRGELGCLTIHLLCAIYPAYTTWNESHIVEAAAPAGHFVQKNLVKQPSSPGVVVAQWLEHQTGQRL